MQEITSKQFQDQKLIEYGIRQGAFQMVLKLKEALGIEIATQLSGFSKEELETEKLNMIPAPDFEVFEY